MTGLYLNIQGLSNNFNEIELIINKREFDFICLSETHLSDLDSDELVEIDEYNLIRADSTSRHTGGVCVYLKKTWTYSILNRTIIGIDFWWLSLKINSGQNSLILIVFYRAPRYLNLNSEFFSVFQNVIDNIIEFNNMICITGDININWRSNDNDKTRISEIINDFGLKQILCQYTRVTKTSKSLIDYVIVNDYYNIKANVEQKYNVSDHETIEITINKKIIPKHEQKIVKYINYDKDKLNNRICSNDIMTIYFLDCNQKAEKFTNNFKKFLQEFTVIKNINLKI